MRTEKAETQTEALRASELSYRRLFEAARDGILILDVDNDPRLTANTYADASLFSLRGAVEKLGWNGSKVDAQINAQRLGASGHLPSLPVTTARWAQPEESSVDSALKSPFGALCRGESNDEEWWALQDSNQSNGQENKGNARGDAQRDAQKLASSIAEIKRVIIAWPKLGESLKAAILAIIGSVASSSANSTATDDQTTGGATSPFDSPVSARAYATERTAVVAQGIGLDRGQRLLGEALLQSGFLD